MRLNKKAFTLIELLAVIAILAIVMIIAVPTVLNTIATAKKGAFKDSVLSIVKDAETKIVEKQLNSEITVPLENEYMVIDISSLDFENKSNYNGFIIVTNEGGTYNFYPYVKDKTYCVEATKKNNITISDIKENCTNITVNTDIYLKDNKLTSTVNGSAFIFIGKTLEGEKVYTFKGTDSYTVDNLAVDTTAGAKTTVEFWMYWDGKDDSMPVGFYQYDIWLRTGGIGFNTGVSEVLGTGSSSLKNKWVHVAAVFYNGIPTNATNKIYINGALQSSSFIVGTSTTNRTVTQNFAISGWRYDDKHRFSGQVKNVRIWKGEISSTQINENMNKIINEGTNLIYSSDK